MIHVIIIYNQIKSKRYVKLKLCNYQKEKRDGKPRCLILNINPISKMYHNITLSRGNNILRRV